MHAARCSGARVFVWIVSAASLALAIACEGSAGGGASATVFLVEGAGAGAAASRLAPDAAAPPIVAPMAPPERTVDARRSLAITELPVLERFGLERVLAALASESGVPGLSALALFQQLWDTQNPGPGLGAGPHCDDSTDPVIGPVLGGFPYDCRPAPAEGAQATCDPFAAESPCAYIPIGLFNRFDLAPLDGAHCGEYRIVYAKSSGIADRRDRNLVIFEAVLPNPHPTQGIMGCKRIADFWADLSEMELDEGADALERFYFDGYANIDPVVSVAHYGDNALGAGQLRTNQFMQPQEDGPPRVWTLREFKLLRTCSGGACEAMRFVPATAKGNPIGALFAPDAAHPMAPAFQAFFPSQVAFLAASDPVRIAMLVPDAFDSGQSHASGTLEMNYLAYFSDEGAPSALAAAIDAQLAALGVSLEASDIVARAQTQSCAGCHRLSNDVALGGGVVWPASLGFTHVTERETETVGGVERYVISRALAEVFLPHRKEVFEDYLNDRPKNAHNPRATLGGSGTH